MARLLSRRVPFWVGLAAALITLVLPLGLTDSQLTVYVFIGLSAIVVTGLALLMGFAGQVSLGQAAFYAIGAYTAALLAKRGLPSLLALALAPPVTALVAGAVGLPLLRLRGHYLAFATLAFQLIVLALIGDARQLTGGDTGLTGIPALSIGPVDLEGRFRTFEYAVLTWLAVAAVLILTRNLVASRPGRGLRALATSEAGALASGVPVGTYKLRVFALSAAYAGLAGGIYGFFVSYIAPGTFPVLLSIQFLVMATVGGLSAIWGSVIGAAMIFLLVQVLTTIATQPGMPLQAPTVLSYAVYALVLILVMLFLPQGLLPALDGRLRRRLSAAVQPQAGGEVALGGADSGAELQAEAAGAERELRSGEGGQHL